MMNENITTIKNWIGTGSINVFGLPLSGKDTVGIRLAETIDGKFLSSGLILREAAKSNKDVRRATDSGLLTPTNQFYSLVLPYLSREDLAPFPLVLSSIGRWSGEEQTVIASAQSASHEIKAVLLLNVSEADIFARWEQVQILQDRGGRTDDRDSEILRTRIQEFRTKTMPVIRIYHDLGLLVSINADQSKEAVFTEVIQKLATFAAQNPQK